MELIKHEIILVLNQFTLEIKDVHNTDQLHSIKSKYLGKKGHITVLTKNIPTLEKELRIDWCKSLNLVKKKVIATLKKYFLLFSKNTREEQLQNSIDYSLPGRGFIRAKKHPITHVIEKLKGIFLLNGFQYVEGNDIEDEWHNFTALNISKNHPSRCANDTFFLEQKNFLLRTHTSNVQVRHMRNNKPPIKIISIGSVYRKDYDSTHTPMFHQLEGLYINDNISLLDLKKCITDFLHDFFSPQRFLMRFRSSYFPFTEPSFEVDIKCLDNLNKKFIRTDWLEIIGCGLVTKKVFSNVGINTNFSGIAFGMGVERLAMLKYGISDIRRFFNGDLFWLQHYGF